MVNVRVQDYTEPELVLKHSHRTNEIRLSKTFAEQMRWLAAKNNKLWSVGTHLKFTYPNHARLNSELSNNEQIKIQGDWLYLSALCDWRFFNSNKAFQEVLQLNPRPVFVYSNLTKSAVVGDSLSQILG